MSHMWAVDMEVWPFNGVDQDLTGPREVRLFVKADDIGKALSYADVFRAGLLVTPCVWQVPIKCIEQLNGAEAQQYPHGATLGSNANSGAGALKRAVENTLDSLNRTGG